MIKSRTILITGASSGIGEALAIAYAAPGILLILSGRNAERLKDVADFCRKRGSYVIENIIDVANRDAMRDWLLNLDQAHPIDLVIANAGISGGTGTLDGLEGENQIRAIFDVNLYGVLNTILPILPRMVARHRGQIALISSMASFNGWPGAPAYTASKGAVRLYGEALRGSLRGSGVQINVVCPGFVISRMTAVNHYKMPFLMKADRAAQIIISGLERNQGRIAFPWPSYLLSGIIGMLPLWFNHCILTRLPKKPPL